MKTSISRKKHNFTIISNKLANDKRLSLQAKGLMLIIMSNDDDVWEYYVSELQGRSTNKEASTRNALGELEEFGYLIRYRKRNSRGQICGYVWAFSDDGEVDENLYKDDNLTRLGLSTCGSATCGKSSTNKTNNNNTNSNEEREEERKKKKEKPKIDFKFLAFIDDVRNFLRPRGNAYPALPTHKYGNIGLNNSNKLYSKRSGKELTAVQANEVFTTAYDSPVFVASLKKYTDIG